MKPEELIGTFFVAYEKRFNDALTGDIDVNSAAGAFADYFIEASPAGVICGKNDGDFRRKIPEDYEFYKSIGTKSMEILSNTVRILDDRHAMAEIKWKSVYEKDGSEIRTDFDVIYFLQITDGKPKIFAYITGDEQKVLQQNGLVPEQ